ncbi:hypothetical protein N0V93_005893 [Gnomoniopsis smithogilvyi]|uniref:Uncharacterized protein n=1 Tax=Gnomoniopsis smithogilvyi TaxID=1191159 RepID=A0A9W9CXK0_9PEZI|nr:hypothetical protein N0V93_005893 [Gnomoniopsis smithogilvyi]
MSMATADENQGVTLIGRPPTAPSKAWLSYLRGLSDRFKQRNGGDDDDMAVPAHSSVPTSTRTSMQTFRWPLIRESIAMSSVPLAGGGKFIHMEAHPRIRQKLLTFRYTKTGEKIKRVETDFQTAGLANNLELDEAFYKFDQLMKQPGTDLELPRSRKTHRRVIIEEEGPPLKQTACILIRSFGSEDEVKVYHAILSKTKWRKYYFPLTLLYEKGESKLNYASAHPEARLVHAAVPRDTLCGTLAIIGNDQHRRVVTIGGVLKFEDRLWATTAAHSIFDEKEELTSSAVSTLTDDMIDPEEYPEDVAEALVLKGADEGARSQLILPPKYTSADAANSADFATLRLLGEAEKSGDDWSLIPITDRAMALPNVAYTHSGEGGASSLENAVYLVEWAKEHPGSCDAEILAGVSGPVAVEMLPGQVEVPLPSGAWVSAWECLVKSGSCLQHGDSGSWIVNPDTGVVYGHVVATMGDSVFMLPMKTLNKEIEGQQEGLESQAAAVLPTPSFILNELAEYHRRTLNDEEAANGYEQAALRAAQVHGHDDSHRYVKQAASKHRWTDPAQTVSPTMYGRHKAKEHASPTLPTGSLVRPKQIVAEGYNTPAPVEYNGDSLEQYLRKEFYERADFYRSLLPDHQRRIDSYFHKIEHIRGYMAFVRQSNFLDDIRSSMERLKDSEEYEYGLAKARSSRWVHSKPNGHIEPKLELKLPGRELADYDPLIDVKVTRTSYPTGDWPTSHIDVDQETIPLTKLLQHPTRWLHRERSSVSETHVTHIHVPATNMEWAQVPFVDWDRPYRYKILTRNLAKIRKDRKDDYEWKRDRANQFSPTSRDGQTRRDPKSSNQVAHYDSFHRLMEFMYPYSYHGPRIESHFRRDRQGRLVAGTAVGQVLLDAARISQAISVRPDLSLLQLYGSRGLEDTMSYRQPLVRDKPATHGFFDYDILYRATAPRNRLYDLKKEAKMLMSGDLWLWVVGTKTVLTCLAPRVGEGMETDSQSLQKEINQAIFDRIPHQLICTVENIMTVILDARQVNLRKESFNISDKLPVSKIAAAKHKHIFSLLRTKTQTLIKDQDLSNSLGNCIAQIEGIVDLTSQQLAALEDLTTVHDVLGQNDISARGIMQLSRNPSFVKLQLRLEGRMKELEELLRRTQNAKSSLDGMALFAERKEAIKRELKEARLRKMTGPLIQIGDFDEGPRLSMTKRVEFTIPPGSNLGKGKGRATGSEGIQMV